MNYQEEAYSRFLRLMREANGLPDLLEAALLISAALGSAVDFGKCRSEVEQMASRVHSRLEQAEIFDPSARVLETIEAINIVLFMEEGFSGNSDDYYDPSNSFLDAVLARRKGIPISLSMLYMEVARSVGLPLHGIGLPGHFVVGYWWSMSDSLPLYIIDVFGGGQMLSAEECVSMVQQLYGEMPTRTDWFQPMAPRSITARMLNNLKQLYTTLNDTEHLSTVLNMLRIVDPASEPDLRERAFMNYRNGNFTQALADIEACITGVPEDEEANRMRYYHRLFERLAVSHN